MKTLKTAEDYFKECGTEPIEFTDEYGLDHTQFLKAIEAKDQELITEIEKMIEKMQEEDRSDATKDYSFADFVIKTRKQALTEVINLIKGL